MCLWFINTYLFLSLTHTHTHNPLPVANRIHVKTKGSHQESQVLLEVSMVTTYAFLVCFLSIPYVGCVGTTYRIIRIG